jgi:subtilisin-like proprotein convertase family protein
MAPANGGVMVGSWSSYPTDASIICYDANPAPEGGQFVFFCFNYGAMDAAVRPLLLENAVHWLLATEIGSCSLAGHAVLAGQPDHSGITVTASPNGGTTTTAADGSYSLPGLYAGTYTITASKADWLTAVQQVTLADNEHRTGLNLTLTKPALLNVCVSPNLAIPDNNSTGVTSTQAVAQTGVIGSIEVYVNITHTYIGDLAVTLTSPAGTSVILHNHTGSSTDNIVGWYPSPLTPAQSLNALLGQPMQGTWSLKVVDNASIDTGRLNQWCLKISYPDPLTAVGDGATPRVVSLGAASPNPFNPRTRIDFALPQELKVDLAIYDLGGRRVATLAAGVLPAGSHEAVWSGRDDAGRAVASGTYFYRLVAGGRTLTGKLALLK